MTIAHTDIRRLRLREQDTELQTTRLVGRGWSWECDCGDAGTWNSTREEAVEYARLHRLYKHGQR